MQTGRQLHRHGREAARRAVNHNLGGAARRRDAQASVALRRFRLRQRGTGRFVAATATADTRAVVRSNRSITALRLILNLHKRVDHILTKQVFGIGITHLTSLLARRSVYCSKYANGPHSIAKSFTSDQGNIWFERMDHAWLGGKCKYCGASQKTLDRGEGFETHAYAFIHTDDIKARMPSCLETTCSST